jgi:OOP family OmpA-OmpF porin
MIRKVLASLCLAALAACATVPQYPGFSKKQVALLEAEGFRPVDGHFELGLSDRLLFAVDDSGLAAAQLERLGKLASALREVGIVGARIEGNTDSTGTEQYNLNLSRRRADAVKSALVGGGMGDDAIEVVGLGESNPLESNATAEGRQENRRVVIVIEAFHSS